MQRFLKALGICAVAVHEPGGSIGRRIAGFGNRSRFQADSLFPARKSPSIRQRRD